MLLDDLSDIQLSKRTSASIYNLYLSLELHVYNAVKPLPSCLRLVSVFQANDSNEQTIINRQKRLPVRVVYGRELTASSPSLPFSH